MLGEKMPKYQVWIAPAPNIYFQMGDSDLATIEKHAEAWSIVNEKSFVFVLDNADLPIAFYRNGVRFEITKQGK